MNLTNAYQDLKSREQWTMLPPLPSPRFSAAAVALNANQAVIMGGYVLNGDGQSSNSSVILYDKTIWREYRLASNECETCGLWCCVGRQ